MFVSLYVFIFRSIKVKTYLCKPARDVSSLYCSIIPRAGPQHPSPDGYQPFVFTGQGFLPGLREHFGGG